MNYNITFFCIVLIAKAFSKLYTDKLQMNLLLYDFKEHVSTNISNKRSLLEVLSGVDQPNIFNL